MKTATTARKRAQSWKGPPKAEDPEKFADRVIAEVEREDGRDARAKWETFVDEEFEDL